MSDPQTSPEDPLVGMIWGVKASFLAYLSGIDDAETSVTDGAGLTPSQEYFFPLADASGFDVDNRTGALDFRGDVRFAGYGRMLFVVVKDPRLSFEVDRIALSVSDVYSKGSPEGRLTIANVEATEPVEHEGTLIWTAMPSRLAFAGRNVFNEVYQAGEQFDPVHVRIPL